MTEGEKQILRFAQNDQRQEWVVVIQSGACYKKGLQEFLLRKGGVYGVGVFVCRRWV